MKQNDKNKRTLVAVTLGTALMLGSSSAVLAGSPGVGILEVARLRAPVVSSVALYALHLREPVRRSASTDACIGCQTAPVGGSPRNRLESEMANGQGQNTLIGGSSAQASMQIMLGH